MAPPVAGDLGLLTFAYANNNPLLYTDFAGLCSTCDKYSSGRSFGSCVSDEMHRQVGNVIGPICLAAATTCYTICQTGNPMCAYCGAAVLATCGPAGAVGLGSAMGWCADENGRCNASPTPPSPVPWQ